VAIQYPLVNGFRFAWSSVEIRLAGDITLGCTEINYSIKTDRAYVRGAGALPIGQTLGNFTYEADLSILVSEFDQFMTNLGPQAMTQFWDIVVSYDSGIGLFNASPLAVVQDTIQSATITEISAAVSSGSSDGLVRKITLMPSGLLLNGVAATPDQPTVSG
jgi:hypothetical protein